MSNTKKLTLSAITVTLGTVIMALGAILEVMDLTTCCFASLLVMLVYTEIGSPYTWLVWLCTSFAMFMILPAKPIWGEYLFIFGIYPILKAYIERTTRWLWLILKALFFAVVIVGAYFVCELLLGVPFFETEVLWLKVGTSVLIAVCAATYDMFLTVMFRFYVFKIRPRIKNLLK